MAATRWSPAPRPSSPACRRGVALTDLAGISALDGTATASLDVGGRGQSWGEFARSIAGTAKVDGRRRLARRLRRRRASPRAMARSAGRADAAPATATTAFSAWPRRSRSAKATSTTDDLTHDGQRLHASPLAGKGSVLNGLVDAKARDRHGGADEVPLAITGRWRAPIVARDARTEPAPATVQPAGRRRRSRRGG